jgi:hypothetical protein
MSQERSYDDCVEDIAREIIERCGLDDSDWHDAIHEDVDSSSWIIYTANHEEVLNNTNNEPDGDEVRSMCADDADWRDMRQMAAYMAMERDVAEKCQELVSDYFECDECSEVFHEEKRAEDNEDYCQGCSLECHVCNATFRKSENQSEEGKEPRCSTCEEPEEEEEEDNVEQG